MPWLQISINTHRRYSDQAENALLTAGASSVTYSDAADEPILEPAPGETPVWNQSVITGLFEHPEKQASLLALVESELYNMEYSINAATLDDQNWSRSWMEHYQPMCFGNRLWVCPWHIEPPEPDAINLRLDPGLAFGTGTHPTTSLCLSWLDKNISQQSRLLDFGCGSGILAVAALLLGVKNADGVDIDPQALDASRLNASSNQVEERFNLFDDEQFRSPGKTRQYDIVMANILSGPLIDLAPVLAAYTQEQGDIVLSGILLEQADDVLNAYENYFNMDAPVVKQEWVLLHGCRKT